MRNFKNGFTMAVFLLFPIILLNISGFCWKKLRWLTDEELIMAAVKSAMNQHTINPSERLSNGKIHYEVIYGVPYESERQFLSYNPLCCEVVREVDEGFRPSVFKRISGGYCGAVKVTWKFRYFSPHGKSLSRPWRKYYFISNCGVAWN